MNRIEHREEKWIFPFVEYSPAEANGKLPLIIQLHGAGERGNGADELNLVDVHGFSKKIKDAEYNALFVMPQCPKDTFWAAKVESVLDFINQIIEAYDVDTKKIYLTGLSMGGYGTWFTAMAKPELFAAIAPVCGGGTAWNAHVLDMPVWAFHGANDTVVSVIQSDEMVESLRKIGADVKYTRPEGVGHDVWTHTYDDELINWFLSKER